MENIYVSTCIILEENPEIQIPIILGSGEGLLVCVFEALLQRLRLGHIDGAGLLPVRDQHMHLLLGQAFP